VTLGLLAGCRPALPAVHDQLSYQRWHARNPGFGTYLLREEYHPARSPKGGLLQARVYEEINRQALPGTEVSIIDLDTHTTQPLFTSAAGEVSVGLIPGSYAVRVQCMGFSTLETKPFSVREGHILHLALYLGADY
jgi:hypothetical protein